MNLPSYLFRYQVSYGILESLLNFIYPEISSNSILSSLSWKHMADVRQSHFHFNPTILRMSMLCCCRSSRTTCQGPVQEDAVELPTEPPRARLSKSLSPMSEIELSSLPVAVPLASSLLHTSIQQAAVDPLYSKSKTRMTTAW